MFSKAKREGLLIFVVLSILISVSYVSLAADVETTGVSKDMPPDGIYLIRPYASSYQTVDFRPEYITSENLVFYTCLEGISSAFSSVVCKDDDINISELPTYPWMWDGCYISYYDLNETDCNEIVVQTEYPRKDEILKIDDEIVLKQVNSIPYDVLIEQDADGGWGDAVSTAYSVWVFSTFNRENFENTYQEQIESGLTWLKENRHESDKCWPDTTCNIKITAMVIALLTESGLDDLPIWHRIIHDGKIWLEKQQNLFDPINPDEGDPSPYNWTFMITGKNWTVGGSNVSINYTTCLIKYASQLDEVMQIPFDLAINVTFVPEHGEYFDYVCTPNDLDVEIFDHRNYNIFNATTANASYIVPGPCWDDEQKWKNCDVETTLFASMIDFGEIRNALVDEWLVEALKENEEGMYFNTSKYITDTAWFLYNRIAKNESETSDDNISISSIEKKIIRWLMYKQNNDGSWANTTSSYNPVIETAISTLALEEVNNGSFSESIADANYWISLNKPVDGWDTTERNALSFMTFSKSAKPFIRTNPVLILMKDNEQEVQLYNPSSFDFTDMEFILDDNLLDIIELEPIGSLLSDYYKDIKLKMKKKVEVSEYGYLTIKNKGVEISKLPVIVQSVPSLNITAPNEIYVFGGKGLVNFNVQKSADVLDCSLKWDDVKITTKSKFRLAADNKITTEVVISEVRNQDVTYTGQFECTYFDSVINIPVSLNTKQFDSIPFTVSPTSLNISSVEEIPSFTIYNNVDKAINVNVQFVEEDAYLAINSPYVEIPPLDSYEVTLTHFFSENESVEYYNSIEVSAYGKYENIDVMVNLQSKKSRAALISFLITMTLTLGMLGGAGYLGYLYKDKLVAMIPPSLAAKFNILTPTQAKAGEKKVESKNFLHIAELIKIMMGLGQDEDEINKRLKSEGYNDGEIAEVMARVKDEMDNEDVLEKEDKFLKLMKSLEMDVGATRSKLKQEGYTDQEIQEAFKQSEEEITKKQKAIKQKITDSERYNVTEEEAKSAAQKADAEKGSGGEGEGGEKKEEKKE
jgi:hypothetical protein